MSSNNPYLPILLLLTYHHAMPQHGGSLCSDNGEFNCAQFKQMVIAEMHRYGLRQLSVSECRAETETRQ